MNFGPIHATRQQPTVPCIQYCGGTGDVSLHGADLLVTSVRFCRMAIHKKVTLILPVSEESKCNIVEDQFKKKNLRR